MTERAAKVCPREPTPEMLNAGGKFALTLLDSWRAMYDAAPPAAVQRQEQTVLLLLLAQAAEEYMNSDTDMSSLRDTESVLDARIAQARRIAHEPCVSGGPSSAPASVERYSKTEGGTGHVMQPDPNGEWVRYRDVAAAPQAVEVVPGMLGDVYLDKRIDTFERSYPQTRWREQWRAFGREMHALGWRDALLQAGDSVAQAERSDEALDAGAHLDYSGGGRVSVDPADIVRSPKVQAQVAAVRELQAATAQPAQDVDALIRQYDAGTRSPEWSQQARAALTALQSQVAELTEANADLFADGQRLGQKAEAQQGEIERLRRTCDDWLAANAPGGWIDDLRRNVSNAGEK